MNTDMLLNENDDQIVPGRLMDMDPFGWALNHENRPVHIRDVKNGKECGCHCPECGGQLIAKQGKIKIWHFSHYDQKSDCPGAAETALHLAAKEILKDLKGRILLPEEIFRKKDWPKPPEEEKYDRRSDFRKTLDREVMAKSNAYYIDSDCLVEIEPSNWLKSDGSGFRPDVVLNRNGRKLLVEIRVTHAVDTGKRTQLYKLGLGAIEIDLQNTARNISRSDLEKLVKEDASRKWLSTIRHEKHKIKEDEFIGILQKKSNNLNKMNLRRFSNNGKINNCPRRDEPDFASGDYDKCMKCKDYNGLSSDFYHTPLYKMLSNRIKSIDESVVFCRHKNTNIDLPSEKQKEFVDILAQNDLNRFFASLKNYLPAEWEKDRKFCDEFIKAHHKCKKCGARMTLKKSWKNNFFWACPNFKWNDCRETNNSIAPVIRRIIDSIPKSVM